ncbi:MAG: hypothetical protein ACKVPJ_13560 [Chitinophagales bacterium]
MQSAELIDILAIQDFSRKCLLANLLARRIFGKNYNTEISAFTNTISSRSKLEETGINIMTARLVAEVEEALLEDAKKNSVKLLFLSACYDMTQKV